MYILLILYMLYVILMLYGLLECMFIIVQYIY
jgi:hypothetical protein